MAPSCPQLRKHSSVTVILFVSGVFYLNYYMVLLNGYTSGIVTISSSIPTERQQRFSNYNRSDYANISGDNSSTAIYIMNYNKHCSTKEAYEGHSVGIVAGLYNTGTNVFYNSLDTNCDHNGYRFWWQPQWGKHELFTNESLTKWHQKNANNQHIRNIYKQSLIMVMIKDPLTWIKSICKANYDFRFFNKTWFRNDCPRNIVNSKLNWIPATRANEPNVNRTSNGIYASIIHVWNAYYEHYFNGIDESVYHHLIIRFEDLLFRPSMLQTKLCDCWGNHKLSEDHILILKDAAKKHGRSHTRSESLNIYSNPQYRYEGYSKQDLAYIGEHINHRILNLFGYHFDI